MSNNSDPKWATDAPLGSSRQADPPIVQLNSHWNMYLPVSVKLADCDGDSMISFPLQEFNKTLLKFKETGEFDNSSNIPKHIQLMFISAVEKMTEMLLKNEKDILKLKKHIQEAETASNSLADKYAPTPAYPLVLKTKTPCIAPYPKYNSIIKEADENFLKECVLIANAANEAIRARYIQDANALLAKLQCKPEIETLLEKIFGEKLVMYCPENINYWDSTYSIISESEGNIRHWPITFAVRKLAMSVSATEARKMHMENLFEADAYRKKKEKEVAKETAAKHVVDSMQTDCNNNGINFDKLVEAIASKITKQLNVHNNNTFRSPKNQNTPGTRGRSPTRRSQSPGRSRSAGKRSKSRSKSRSVSRSSSRSKSRSPSGNRNSSRRQSPKQQQRQKSRSQSPGRVQFQQPKAKGNQSRGRSPSPYPDGILRKKHHNRDWGSRSSSPKHLKSWNSNITKNNRGQYSGKEHQSGNKVQNGKWKQGHSHWKSKQSQKGEREYVLKPFKW